MMNRVEMNEEMMAMVNGGNFITDAYEVIKNSEVGKIVDKVVDTVVEPFKKVINLEPVREIKFEKWNPDNDFMFC